MVCNVSLNPVSTVIKENRVIFIPLALCHTYVEVRSWQLVNYERVAALGSFIIVGIRVATSG
jgi:hypothetical protein